MAAVPYSTLRAVARTRISFSSRRQVEDHIEGMIALLDRIDADPELEPANDDEPSLGWPEHFGIQQFGSYPEAGIDDDREQDNSDMEESDEDHGVDDVGHDVMDEGNEEMSLGWSMDMDQRKASAQAPGWGDDGWDAA